MLSRIYNTWQILRGSLWFAPAFICLIYFLGTLGLYFFEKNYALNVEEISMLYHGDIANARSLITTLLSAMITTAALVISITMVVLSLSASQLGPRLIRSFMSDEKTQLYIGMFFGTVVACFVLTGILHDESLFQKPPSLTITAVLLACFANLFCLLAFTDHIAKSSIADSVITRVGNDLFLAIRRLCHPHNGKENPKLKDSSFPAEYQDKAEYIFFSESGYIQNIDYSSLNDLAAEHDIFIQLSFKAGHYLIPGENGVWTYPADRVSEDVREGIVNSFILGNSRTSTQDMEYSIRHLVEIALRALSPGINDSFTALTVLDRLSTALANLLENKVYPNIYADENDVVRVIGKQSTEADIIFTAFSQIRNAGQSKPDILHHMMRRIKTLKILASATDTTNALDKQLSYIQDHIAQNFSEGLEKTELLTALADCRKS